MTSAAGGSGELPIGATFAGYRIEELIGRGGMGAVYRVRDVSLDHERALKILDGRLAADGAFRERFQRESRMTAAIEDPAIATVHRAGEEDDRLFIAMRLVRGPDLRRLVDKDGPLEPRRTARIVGAVAGALDAAHRRGIVHRDVKPANILVELGDDGEHTYLTDFGIGRPSGGSDPITSTGELIGTADFIAPEQIEGKPAQPASDIYALGCVVFYLLTGESPFARETQLATLFAHANAPRPRPSAITEGLPAAIDDVVVKATAIEPADRHASARELAAELSVAAGGSTAAAHAQVATVAAAGETPTSKLPAPRRRSRRLLAAAGGVALLALAAATFVVLSGDDDTPASKAPGVSRSTLPADVTAVALGDPVDAIVVGKKNVLATSHPGDSLFAIDPVSAKVVRGPERLETPSAVAIGFGSVWVASSAAGELLRFGPGHREVPERIAVGDDPADIAVDERWVWVANRGDGSVSRVDPYTGAVAEAELRDPPSAIAAAEGAVWVASVEGGSLQPIEASSISAKAPAAGGPVGAVAHPSDLVIASGSLWVTDSAAGTLSRLGLGDGAPLAEPLTLGGEPGAIASGLGGLWVADAGAGTVSRLDPNSDDVAAVDLGNRPQALSVGPKEIWVADAGTGEVSRITP